MATPPSARLELAVDRLRSDNPLFERELRRRADARRHPGIVGELRLLAGDDGGFELKGEQVFDIRDFGIDPPRLLMLKADPEVRVRVRLVARRAASS
jgi:hypothetical protein